MKYYDFFIAVDDLTVRIFGVREVMVSAGVFAYELQYTVQSATTVFNAQTTASVSSSVFNIIVSSLTESRVSVMASTSITTRSVTNSLSFYVSASLSTTDNMAFISALQTFYLGKSDHGFSCVTCIAQLCRYDSINRCNVVCNVCYYRIWIHCCVWYSRYLYLQWVGRCIVNVLINNYQACH